VLHAAIVEQIRGAPPAVTRLTVGLLALLHNAAMTSIRSPLQAQIVQWLVQPGDTVRSGDVVAILEAMKMEHEVRAEAEGRITELLFAEGEMVNADEVLLISERITHIPRIRRHFPLPSNGIKCQD
jgi:biotin carboxyl carrier protein